MKYSSFFVIVFFYSLPQSSLVAQPDNHTVTIFRHIKLKKIPVSLGMPFSLEKFGNPPLNSLQQANRYFFENATIRKIKSCKLNFIFRDGVLQHLTIYLSGQKSFAAAKKQASKEFGQTIMIFDSHQEIYMWNTRNEQENIQISLHRKNGEWGAEMDILSER